MGEEVAAEQGAGCLVVEVAGFPAVRQVWGVDPPESVSADVEHVIVGEWSRFSVGDVADGDHAAGGAGHGGGVGGGGEPLVERAALVGLDVTDVLNEIAQATRFAAGEVDPRSHSVPVGTNRAHVGDVVATRRNERTLLTDRQRMVKNRDRWTVAAVHRDGSLTVDGSTGRVTLPAEYVAADVELAYAETSHATQGRTVDRSFLYLDGPTGTAGIYVPLTRGRTSNEAFVVLHD